jgi:hypothetical protein
MYAGILSAHSQMPRGLEWRRQRRRRCLAGVIHWASTRPRVLQQPADHREGGEGDVDVVVVQPEGRAG